jgi:hypothetical protein
MADDFRTGQRFPLALPLKIGAGSRQRQGKTRNLSAAGVLIEADPSLRVGAKVQFCITLPRELLGVRKDVDVQCDGRVVRVEKKGTKAKTKKNGERSVGVACIIDNYAFKRRK